MKTRCIFSVQSVVNFRSLKHWVAGLVFVLLSCAQGIAKTEGFSDMAEALLPTVVNISTTQMVKANPMGEMMPFMAPGSPFEDFFKDFLGPDQNGGLNFQKERKVSALGSGFIVDPSGYVVTNNHVIDGADEIKVILQDNTELSAKVVGHDQKTDLALLKVETASPLPAVVWGDSDVSRVGDWIMAIGNPFGLGGTVTAGIISARSRHINDNPYEDFIQTDAAINRGNSGGPMFNMEGKVIGINTFIVSPSGGNVGIGFAIPSNLAKPVIDQLREHGSIKRGWIGVRIQEITPEIAEGLGLGQARGALVASVGPDTPAASAGIVQGDVLLSFDGQEIKKMSDLPRVVAKTPIGKKVTVEIWSRGETKKLTLVVGELKDTNQEVAEEKPNMGGAGVDVGAIGLTVQTMPDDLKKAAGVPKDKGAVIVTSVHPKGEAAEKNIKIKDVILEVNQSDIKDAKDFSSKIEKNIKEGKKSVVLLVKRRDVLSFVAVRLGDTTKKTTP